MSGVTLDREAEDALFALFAVKLGVLSEAAIEKYLPESKASGTSLSLTLVAKGRLTAAKRNKVQEQLDPEVIPGFRIEGEAGRGGMGVVYKARQLSLDRIVALKVLSRRLSQDPSYVGKFLEEARSAAKLNHENVVSAIDAGEADGLHYFAMEFVNGTSVADLLDDDAHAEGLGWERTFEIAERVGRALEHAHTAGIVHRDVKPENIMIGPDGVVKLCDLGLAKPAAVAGTGEKSDTTEGTPYYCSPEQALGRTDIDARSDVYALGATLFHMLKGEPPYDGPDARSILVQQVRRPFPSLSAELPHVPEPFRALLKRMVVKERDERLASMREFAEGLTEAWSAHRNPKTPSEGFSLGPWPTTPRGWAPLAATFVGCLLVGSIVTAVAMPSDSSSEVADAPDSTPDDVAPDDEPRRTPRVTRVDPADEGPDEDPEQAQRERREQAAQVLWEDAREFRRNNPDDTRGLQLRLQGLIDTYGETRVATAARAMLEALEELPDSGGGPSTPSTASAAEEAIQGLEPLDAQVSTRLGEFRFQAAIGLIDSYDDAWGHLELSTVAERLEVLRNRVDTVLSARYATLKTQLDEAADDAARAAAREALVGLQSEAWGEVAAQITAALEADAAAAAMALAVARWAEVAAAVDGACRRGAFDEAARVVAGAQREDVLAPVADRVEAAAANVTAIQAVEARFAEQVQVLRDDRSRLALREGEALRGRLEGYDGAAWTCAFKEQGHTESNEVDFRDVESEQLLGWVLPTAEGRGNVLYFLARRAPEAAEAALEAYAAAGGDGVEALRTKLAAVRAQLVEETAERRLAWILAAERSSQEVVEAVRGLDASLPDTRAYAAQFDALRARFQNALAALLVEEDVSGLLRGDVRTRRDEVEISYDFEDPAQLEDWIPETDLLNSSQATWSDESMRVRGKVRHAAVFLPGEVEMEFRLATADNDRPNVNIMLSDTGGWNGVLLGLGFQYADWPNLRVDPSAPRKPGYRVPLPANVLLVLSGQAPNRQGTNLVAEDDPSMVGAAGRMLRVEIDRNEGGDVRIKVNRQRVFSFTLPEDAVRAGGVSLVPLGTELLVSEVEIKGRLDPAWVTTRSQEVAAQEANALPPPRAGG